MERIIIAILSIFGTCSDLTEQVLHGSQSNVCRIISNPKKWHCCSFYYELDGECKACENGSESIHGKICKPCGTGFYGYRCLKHCKCSVHERCDHILGCVQTSDIESSDAPTTVWNRGRDQTTDFDHTTNLYKDQSTNDIYDETFVFGTIIVILFVSIVFIQIFKCIRETTLTTSNTVAATYNNHHQLNTGNYDEIDDTVFNRTDRNSDISIQNDKVSSDTSRPSSGNSIGYLNPYQTIISESVHHNYDIYIATDENEAQEETTEMDDRTVEISISFADGIKKCDESDAYITPIV